MELIADRFAVHEDTRAFDLATSARVRLIVGSAGGVSEQLRWTDVCTARRALHHRGRAALVDFGLVGECSRFEAWSICYPAREGHTPGVSGGLKTADCGLRIIEQPAVAVLAEMFHAAGVGRPHVSSLFGPPGAGKRVIAGELARIARTRGFVPVAARLVDSRQADLWSGRSLFVIAHATEASVWQAFLNAALKDPQSHVLLLIGEEECRSIDGVGVRPLSVEALVSAVEPPVRGRPLEKAVRRAAARSRGFPGRFAQILWPGWHEIRAPAAPSRRSTMPRVAEQVAVYGGEAAVGDLFDAVPVPCAWPAPGELMSLRRKMETAIATIAQGRHAPGTRQLRQVVGSLARRGAWSDAAHGALALAGALLRRGRTRDALTVIDEGREYAVRAADQEKLVDLASLAGEAWVDLARLDEADSVLGTAMAAARDLADPERIAAASLVLARTAYWRGAYADADTILTAAPESAALRVRRSLLASRIAVGLGDLSRAMSILSAIPEPLIAGQAATTKAAVAGVAAFVHIAVGDWTATERDLAQTLTLARAARDPHRATRARLLRAELERSRSRPAAALSQLHRLRRLVAAAPPVVRMRWELAKALCAPGAEIEDTVAKQVRSTGLGALGLYAGTRSPSDPLRASVPSGGSSSDDGLRTSGVAAGPFVDEVVAILRVCQTAADEVDVLKQVCARLRHHLHAAAVAVLVVHGDRVHGIASEGARFDAEIGERAIAAGITIAPHRVHDRVEAAAPIAYGGAPIGALCARWAIGSTHDTSLAPSVLTMSAAAAAPVVAAVKMRQGQVDGGAPELLGITSMMTDLRRSVERAAAAPFAVLIDGESGSGKELVARAIHRGSARRTKGFCTLNCAALPDDLLEAELFGHTRGAFTGAVADRAGVFEEAHGGTLFLDEVGELSLRAQAKLLRVIQEGELRRVGENASRRVDVRIVSATNRSLQREVEAARFRLDLLYRLDVVHIAVPPLRERREDVALLAEHFWRDAAARVGSRATLGAATLAALARYDWPGNVRELQNVLAALAVRTPKRGLVPPTALPSCFGERGSGENWLLDEARRTFELRFVRAALVRTGGHRGRAAAELGVTRQGLTKLMTRLGIAT
jgi:DNA-binding NtrC family response regulator